MPSASSEPNARASPSAQSTWPSAYSLAPRLELLGQLRVDGEARRARRARGGDAVEQLAVDAGLAVTAATIAGGGAGRLVGFGGARLARLVERGLEAGGEVVERLLGLLERDVAPLDERLGVELAHRPAPLDPLVHLRLRVARLVTLVVAEAAVAHHVDHDVLLERLPEGEREARHPHARLGVVAVDVEDRRLDHLGHVGRVDRRARRLGDVVKPTWLLMTRWTVPPVR